MDGMGSLAKRTLTGWSDDKCVPGKSLPNGNYGQTTPPTARVRPILGQTKGDV